MQECLPSTTPTPTLLLLVFIGATKAQSLVLGLYASTEAKPGGKKDQSKSECV